MASKKPLTKSQIVSQLAEKFELSKKAAAAFLERSNFSAMQLTV